MSPVLSLGIFILALMVSTEASKRDPNKIAGTVLLVSLAYLGLYGPSALGFGLSIGSGWALLNQTTLRMFPE